MYKNEICFIIIIIGGLEWWGWGGAQAPSAEFFKSLLKNPQPILEKLLCYIMP